MTQQVKWYGDKLLATIRDATPDALFAAGEQFVTTAAAKARRRSGELARSGYVSTTKRSTYKNKKTYRKEVRPPKPTEAAAGFAIFYALFQERGTRNMSAKPFMRPALDELKGQLGATIANKVREKLK